MVRTFLLRMEGVPKKHGFYVTRDVEASSFEAAEDSAVELLRKESKIVDITLNDKDDSPMLYVDNIRVLAPGEEGMNNSGYVYYVEDESS